MNKSLIFLFLLVTFITIQAVQVTKSHKKSEYHNHQNKNQTKKSHLHKNNQKSVNAQNFLEIPLKTNHKSPNNRLNQINELSEHQAILLGKDQFAQIQYDSELNEHFSNMIELKSFKRATIVNKDTVPVFDYQQQQKKTYFSGKKSFLKISEKEGVSENEHTTASLPLKNHQNTFFTGEVAVGDTDNNFDIIFDTGSSLTFINSVHCGDQGCEKGTQYDSDESDSHEDLGADVEVEFGSGTLRGRMASENFYINGMSVPDTVFIEITKQEGAVFDDGDFDGIVGLSFPDLGDDTPTLFDFMIEKDVIAESLFSFYMNRQAGSNGSKVMFGAYDQELMEEELVYHDVSEELYWSVNAEQIRIGDQDTGICSADKPCKLVLDSGTSLFTGPSNDLQLLLKNLQTDDGCKNLYDLDDIVFVIDGVDYPVNPEEYILTVTKEGIENPYEHSDMDKVIQCVGAFYALDIEEPAGPLWVLGDVFMSKYYTVFKKGAGGSKSQIGLAKAFQK